MGGGAHRPIPGGGNGRARLPVGEDPASHRPDQIAPRQGASTSSPDDAPVPGSDPGGATGTPPVAQARTSPSDREAHHKGFGLRDARTKVIHRLRSLLRRDLSEACLGTIT